MKKQRMILWFVCLLTSFFMIRDAMGAEVFPTKPLELVVPFAAGGSTDVMCRTLVARAAPFLNNQPVIVVNKAGGTTVVGSRYVLDGRNDGYTLYSISSASMMTVPIIQKTGYSWRDFVGIAQTWIGSGALWVKADFPYDTMEKFIEYAKQNPGKIKYSSTGAGTQDSLAMEGLAADKGIVIKNVPTKGDSEAILALLGGQVVAAIGPPLIYKQHLDAGKIKCLGQYGTERDKSILPNIPTFKEKGVNVAMDIWRWIVVPKGVPPERVKVLSDAFKKILHDEATRASMEKIQSPVLYLPPEEYERSMKRSEAVIVPLIKAAKLD